MDDFRNDTSMQIYVNNRLYKYLVFSPHLLVTFCMVLQVLTFSFAKQLKASFRGIARHFSIFYCFLMSEKVIPSVQAEHWGL